MVDDPTALSLTAKLIELVAYDNSRETDPTAVIVKYDYPGPAQAIDLTDEEVMQLGRVLLAHPKGHCPRRHQ